jgi:N-acetylmuramate 1-kinase
MPYWDTVSSPGERLLEGRMPESSQAAEPAARLREWAAGVWPGGRPEEIKAEPIAPDGSTRLFLRLHGGKGSLVALANPDNPAENRAWAYFARLMAGLGLPVAEVLAQDLDRGFFLMRDLGRGLLQEEVLAVKDDAAAVESLYEPVLRWLVALHQRGAKELDRSVCFDGAELDAPFLLGREAGYFLEQYALGAAGLRQRDLPRGLHDEMVELCRRAAGAQPWGLVHRDLQSRNIILHKGRYGLVDFQGARLGPVAYDLASLLHDPYVDLPWRLRQGLARRYTELARTAGPFDAPRFMAGWPLVSASRAMQALGAYGFLTRVRGRGHFAPYMQPALASLDRLTASPELREFTALRDLTLRLLR